MPSEGLMEAGGQRSMRGCAAAPANARLAGISTDLAASCGSRRDLIKAWRLLLSTVSLSTRPAQGFSSELNNVGPVCGVMQQQLAV